VLEAGLEALRAGSGGVGSTLRPVSPTGWKLEPEANIQGVRRKTPRPLK